MEEQKSVIKKNTFAVFIMADCSRSMLCDNHVGIMNQIIDRTIHNLSQLQEEYDVDVCVGLIKYADNASLEGNSVQNISHFSWEEISLGFRSSFGKACSILQDSLKEEIIGKNKPVIILINDGGATDEYQEVLASLAQNECFQKAQRLQLVFDSEEDYAKLDPSDADRMIQDADEAAAFIYEELVKQAAVFGKKEKTISVQEEMEDEELEENTSQENLFSDEPAEDVIVNTWSTEGWN